MISKTGNWTADGPVATIETMKRQEIHHENDSDPRHAAHASAHDHPGRFYSGLVVAALGTGLWLAEVARMIWGQ
mgnify:CR=1 FL=1